MENKKMCSKCKESKELTEFGKNKNAKDYLQSRCKRCVKLYQVENKEKLYQNGKRFREKKTLHIKKYREENKNKYKISSWKNQGIKCNDFKDLYETYKIATNCYLCDVIFDNKEYRKCLDHDHLSGYVRFFCCNKCNKKLERVDNKRKDVLLELHRYFNY